MADELYSIAAKELLHMSVKRCDIAKKEESFNKIRRWLNGHKDERSHLEESANYFDIFGRSTLHLLLRTYPPLDLVDSLLRLAPSTVQTPDDFGDYPLHWACRYKASAGVVKMILEAFPEAVRLKGEYGMLPLHHACKYGAPSEVVEVLTDAFPESVTEQDNNGKLALDYALAEGDLSQEIRFSLSPKTFREVYQREKSMAPEDISYKILCQELFDVCNIMSKDLLSLCVEAWRNDRNNEAFDRIRDWLNENEDNHIVLEVATNKKDEDDRTPMHWLVRARPPFDLVERLLQIAPHIVEVADKNGEYPLHWACRYDASHEVVKAILTSFPRAAEVPDRYGKLPLHSECISYAPFSHTHKDYLANTHRPRSCTLLKECHTAMHATWKNEGTAHGLVKDHRCIRHN
jgi:ankyrin repeat protein